MNDQREIAIGPFDEVVTIPGKLPDWAELELRELNKAHAKAYHDFLESIQWIIKRAGELEGFRSPPRLVIRRKAP